MRERTINYAYDNERESILDIRGSISSQKEGFTIRSDYNSDTSRFTCMHCSQILVVAHSVNDNVYFRHLPNSAYCVLRDNSLSDDVLDGYRNAAFARESNRHKELKNEIGRLLQYEEDVDKGSIDIDTKFLTKGDQKRRPDVYCSYKDNKIAFEIQLSYLPQHYIMHRYQFYRDIGVYLIWIIDLKTPQELKTFERDVKYIWPHQNLFRLDESEKSTLKMICHFKQPFIFEDIEVRERWSKSTVGLSKLQFNSRDYSCYYYKYNEALNRRAEELIIIQEQQREKEKEEGERAEQNACAVKIRTLWGDIEWHSKQNYNFYRLIQRVNNLDNFEIETLNQYVRLNSLRNETPSFLHYIKEYIPDNKDYVSHVIVDLLLSCSNIKFNINQKDRYGHGVIQYLYQNKHLRRYVNRLLPFIFSRKYKVSQEDRLFLKNEVSNSKLDCIALDFYMYSQNEFDILFVKNNLTYLLFIESATEMNRLNSNVKSWVQYMMPIMSKYRSYWKYTKEVLNKTRLGKELRLMDKNKTIDKKIIEFDLENTSQDKNVIHSLRNLYPEIFLM